jgi:hypothetical protein
MFYFNADLYRYWIGRPDQSVQRDATIRRYSHQLLVTEKCFAACHLDDIENSIELLAQFLCTIDENFDPNPFH